MVHDKQFMTIYLLWLGLSLSCYSLLAFFFGLLLPLTASCCVLWHEVGINLLSSLQFGMGQAGDQCLPTGLCAVHFWPGGCAGKGGTMWNAKDNDVFDMREILCIQPSI